MRAAAFSYVYDHDTGEGQQIKFSGRFQAECQLMHLDVLKDAIYDLTELYNAILKQWGDEFEAKRKRRQTT